MIKLKYGRLEDLEASLARYRERLNRGNQNSIQRAVTERAISKLEKQIRVTRQQLRLIG